MYNKSAVLSKLTLLLIFQDKAIKELSSGDLSTASIDNVDNKGSLNKLYLIKGGMSRNTINDGNVVCYCQ